MAAFLWFLVFLVGLFTLSYQRASLIVWTIAIAVWLLLLTFLSNAGTAWLTTLWVIFGIIFIPLNIYPFRRVLFTKKIFSIYRKMMPKMSETEKEALAAGTVGWTADLFSGMPNWKKFHESPLVKMSEEEQSFLDNEVETLCSMIDNWKISRSMQIPDEIWDYVKKEGFLGMIIPKKYGGKQFSAMAHSAVIVKVSAVSVAVSTIISVPNSLGPAELLLRYGTEEQKDYYLPRLAKAEEIPCFALTSPVAGSDASSIVDNGIICRHEFEGEEQLCIRLNWNKRYITLSPVATLLGLAFKLYDPDHLLGKKEYIGITCALIPTHLPGVVTGRRHYPLDSAFPNGPTQGKDVIIPVDWIIGGVKMAGHGWRMLMESLAAGRSISLPSMVTGGAKFNALAAGAYSRVRRQFNTYIGNFGGVSEVLTRIASNAYKVEALRSFTISALDQKQKPAIASAICKYHTTELSRDISRDTMDIHGGKGICMGPNNYIAQGYIELPISITVEGANILTRSMIIFGQGIIRAHPYVLREMTAAEDSKDVRSLRYFDRALFQHIGFLISNISRAFLLGLSNGHMVMTNGGPLKRYYQLFTRFSAILALTGDVCVLTLGGSLKRREKISARLGDILSLLYMGSAVMKMHESVSDNKEFEAEFPLVEWICQDILYKLQITIDDLLVNFPSRFISAILRMLCLPLGKCLRPPRDKLGSKVAKLLLEPSVLRERFTKDIYLTPNKNNPAGYLHELLEKVIAIEPLEKKLGKAIRAGDIKGKNLEERVQSALSNGIFTKEEAKEYLEIDRARMAIINVDDFGPEFFERHQAEKPKVSEAEPYRE